MRRFVYAINNISEWSGKLIFWMAWAMGAIIVYEIILRDAFNQPTIWAHESSMMLFGAYSILGGAYALRHRAHVNMDLLYGRLSTRGKAIADIVSSFLFFAFCGILLWQSWGFALRSIEIGETSISYWRPIIWPVKCTMIIGAFLILLQGVGKFVADTHTAITGKGIK